jgi:hypothetical protein
MMCAVQPVMRAAMNSGVKISVEAEQVVRRPRRVVEVRVDALARDELGLERVVQLGQIRAAGVGDERSSAAFMVGTRESPLL